MEFISEISEKQPLFDSFALLKEDKNIDVTLYNEIPWKNVESSHIEKVAFDRKNQKLYVKFKNRILAQKNEEDIVVYRYDNFSSREYKELLNAPSKGQYLHAAVKGKKPFIRLWVVSGPRPKRVRIYARK